MTKAKKTFQFTLGEFVLTAISLFCAGDHFALFQLAGGDQAQAMRAIGGMALGAVLVGVCIWRATRPA